MSMFMSLKPFLSRILSKSNETTFGINNILFERTFSFGIPAVGISQEGEVMSNEDGADRISVKEQREQEIKARLISCKERGAKINEDDGLISRLFGSFDNEGNILYRYVDSNGKVCGSLIFDIVTGFSSKKKTWAGSSYRGTNELDDMLQEVALFVFESLDIDKLTVEEIKDLDLAKVVRVAFNNHYAELRYKDMEALSDPQENRTAAAETVNVETSFADTMADRITGCYLDSPDDVPEIKTSVSQNYQYKKDHRNSRKQEYLQKYLDAKKMQDSERKKLDKRKLKRLHRLEETGAEDPAAPSDSDLPETERSKAWRKRRLIYRVKFYKAKQTL